MAGGAALLLFGLSLSAQTPATTAPSVQPAAWTTYDNSADGFSVLFPDQPDVQKNKVPTNSGTFELHAYLVTPGAAALYIGVCDYGATAAGRNPQDVLTGAKNGAIDNVKAHMLTEESVLLGTYPGVQFEAENDTLHFSARIFLVGTTLYQELTASPLTEKYADSTRFLDSFKLIPRTAN
jgi:hypothetical protein